MWESKPHPANVPGDFYVEDNCCTMCGVPLHYAPELFGQDGEEGGPQDCFVKKQPETDEELDHMMNVIKAAELACIHYRGRDQKILQRLVQMGEREVCDHLPSNATDSQ